MNKMTTIREIARNCTRYVVDDSGWGRPLNADPWAIVMESGVNHVHASVLVGWQRGYEPIFVAVYSYLDFELTDSEAVKYATEYLAKIGWIMEEGTEPDYVIR
jgi:hypothetical protein